MIQSCANKLVSDVETDGEVVMDILRKQYKSLYSLDAKASNVRQTVISQGSFSSEYNDFELRTKYGNEAAVVKFLNATLKEKCSIRRAYKYCDPPFSIGAMNALLKMQILPRAMNSFHMTSSEMVELKSLKDQAILNKNNTLILIPDAAALLKSAIRWLEIVSIRSSDAQIVLPLLLVSGRRESEICNGNSLFNPSDLGPTYCVFSGQLKTKSEIDRPFTIPLLIDYSLFVRGLNIWRQKKGSVDSLKTNANVCAKYSANLRRDLLKVVPLVQSSRKVHTLRSIYIQFVWMCYENVPCTFARLCMTCLGHASLNECHAYSNVRLENTSDIKLGNLRV